MGSTVSHGNSVSLCRTDSEVGAQFPRRCQQGKCKWIRGHDGNGTCCVECGDGLTVVHDIAAGAGILVDGSKDLGWNEIGDRITDDEAPTERFGAGLEA